MSDLKILLQVRGKYAHLSRAEAVQRVADENGFTRSGVSGMCSRAAKTVAGQLALVRYKTEKDASNASDTKINALVSDARLTLSRHRAALLGEHYAVYVPDMHIPNQHNAALELAYAVIADLPDVAYVSALNDGLDLHSQGRWSAAASDDIGAHIDAYKHHLAALRLAAPQAVMPAVIGNHDLRMFNDDVGTGKYVAANLMQEFAGAGVLFCDRPDKENVFVVNDGLVWAHGYRAMQDRRNSARKNYTDIRRQVPDELRKTLYDLVIGHTHAAGVFGTADGATVFNSGCLCKLEPDYMRKRPDWQHALTVSRFLPGTDWHETALILFVQRGYYLTARNPFNGKEYQVKGASYA